MRDGAELVCYLPDKRTVLVEKRASERPLLGNFPKFDESSAAFYDVKEVKRTLFLRRDTRIIAVNPRDEFRYGYRLWIDEQTAMPLKTQLCDGRGRVIEQLVVGGSETPQDDPRRRVQAGDLHRRLPVAAYRKGNAGAGSGAERRAVERDQAAAWFPHDGAFQPGDARLEQPGRAPGVLGWPGFRFRVRRAGQGPHRNAPASSSAQVGSSSAFSTVVDDHKVTALGDVPQVTVQSIANSMKAGAMKSEVVPKPSTAPAPALSLGAPPRR